MISNNKSPSFFPSFGKRGCKIMNKSLHFQEISKSLHLKKQNEKSKDKLSQTRKHDSSVPVLIHEYYEKLSIKQEINTGKITINEKNRSLDDIQFQIKMQKLAEKRKPYWFNKNIKNKMKNFKNMFSSDHLEVKPFLSLALKSKATKLNQSHQRTTHKSGDKSNFRRSKTNPNEEENEQEEQQKKKGKLLKRKKETIWRCAILDQKIQSKYEVRGIEVTKTSFFPATKRQAYLQKKKDIKTLQSLKSKTENRPTSKYSYITPWINNTEETSQFINLI